MGRARNTTAFTATTSFNQVFGGRRGAIGGIDIRGHDLSAASLLEVKRIEEARRRAALPGC